MRLYEIASKVNIDRIKDKLYKYFAVGREITIDEYGYINVVGNVSSLHTSMTRKLNDIPIKFNEVDGHFLLDIIELTSLVGSPKKVTKVYTVKNCKITSLEGSPEEVGGFALHGTIIPNLIGSPKRINGGFSANGNKLISLEGCPSNIPSDVTFYDNKLSSLIGGPIHVGGDYNAGNNPIMSLDGLPKSIGKGFYVNYHSDLPLLRLLLVKNLKKVQFYPSYPPNPQIQQIEDILRRYLGKGVGAALACGAELARAGFKGNARK